MSTVLCKYGGYCVRVVNHAGCHTACPSSATLDWDHGREVLQSQHVDAAVTLLALDFPSPSWADLNDG